MESSRSALAPQPWLYFVENLVQARLIGWRHTLFWPDVLAMWMCQDLAVMRGVVVPEYRLIISKVRISVVNTDWIPQLGADHFVDVQMGTIPETDPATKQPVMVVRGKAHDRFFDGADADVPTQTALY